MNWLAWPTRLPFLIDWPAWATIVTGLAAVLAAVYVGRRQIGIADRQAAIAARQIEVLDRQASILERQSRTDALRLRGELFDRRIQLFDSMFRAYQESIGIDDKVEALGLFGATMFRSHFLFDIPTGKAVIEFQRMLIKSYMNRLMMVSLTKGGNNAGFANYFRQLYEHNQLVGDAFSSLISQMGEFLSLKDYEEN